MCIQFHWFQSILCIKYGNQDIHYLQELNGMDNSKHIGFNGTYNTHLRKLNTHYILNQSRMHKRNGMNSSYYLSNTFAKNRMYID